MTDELSKSANAAETPLTQRQLDRIARIRAQKIKSDSIIINMNHHYAYKIQQWFRKQLFIQNINKVFDIYLKSGARSSKKTDALHNFIANQIRNCLPSTDYSVQLECEIPSLNASGTKRCDIVLFRRDKPFCVFPVKFIMTNYFQNKNNNWENLTGEISQLKWAGAVDHIIPINIIFNKTPYLNKNGIIQKFEHVSYDKSFKIMEILREKNLASDVLSYILDVNHTNKIGDKYTMRPHITGFITQFRSFALVLRNILRQEPDLID